MPKMNPQGLVTNLWCSCRFVFALERQRLIHKT
jgi:hypothetical protein